MLGLHRGPQAFSSCRAWALGGVGFLGRPQRKSFQSPCFSKWGTPSATLYSSEPLNSRQRLFPMGRARLFMCLGSRKSLHAMKDVQLLRPFYRWRNWGSSRFTLPKREVEPRVRLSSGLHPVTVLSVTTCIYLFSQTDISWMLHVCRVLLWVIGIQLRVTEKLLPGGTHSEWRAVEKKKEKEWDGFREYVLWRKPYRVSEKRGWFHEKWNLSRGSGRVLWKDGEGGDLGDKKESAPWRLRGRRAFRQKEPEVQRPWGGCELGYVQVTVGVRSSWRAVWEGQGLLGC